DFVMTCRMGGIHTGVSRLYYSYDRGHSWKGPFRIPLFDQPGIAARTDYIVNGPHDCHLFLPPSKSNNREGTPICARTTAGARASKLVSVIGAEPKGYSIMPSTVRLSPRDLVTTLRRLEEDPKRSWIEAWRSGDNGESWTRLNEPAPDT